MAAVAVENKAVEGQKAMLRTGLTGSHSILCFVFHRSIATILIYFIQDSHIFSLYVIGPFHHVQSKQLLY